MEQRISLITLGVSDLARAKSFYAALGWRGTEVEETVFHQAGGMALVLWDRRKLAADCGLPDAPPAGFGGIALAHNVRTDAEVDSLLGAAAEAGGTVTRPAAVNAIGFYSGVFTDPDGHAWEIAHNPGFTLAGDGSLILPDFASLTPAPPDAAQRTPEA
ncbi:VOC family protein [Streptomyces sp. NPDC091371]|uniref:VOC family protein n=1 Tax=Streptomyces sp. NPDC091371 TaxID=3155303 RepID=UPI00342CDC42